MDTVKSVAASLRTEYAKTPSKLKVIDCFLLYAVLNCGVQFLYMLTVGSFPFNSFLSGFFCSLGVFVLTLTLRMQLNPANAAAFPGLSPERAHADYVLCGCLLFFVAWNFMG